MRPGERPDQSVDRESTVFPTSVWSLTLSGDPLAALATLASATVEHERLRRQYVRAAADNGNSWPAIASALGVAELAAWRLAGNGNRRGAFDPTPLPSSEATRRRVAELRAVLARGWLAPSPPCTRLYRNGKPCRARCASAPLGGAEPACARHLTDAEAAAREEAERYLAALWSAVHPACWSWPVPTADQVEAELEGLSSGLKDLVRDVHQWNMFHAGRCALCGSSESSLVEDHNHSTGFVRGLLCKRCNLCEGRAAGEPFEQYRQRNPATILGQQFRYVNDWVSPLFRRS